MPRGHEDHAVTATLRETKSQTLHLRVTEDLDRRLRSKADQQNERPATLAERLLDEGLRTIEHPLIRFEDGVFGRRPMLVGSRLDVPTVVETIRQHDGSIEAAAEYLGQSIGAVDACAAYYADYRDDVDRWLRLAREEATRLREQHERRQEAGV